MSPRAAWRLESLGFGDVYDYVGSKMDWIGAGLPFEGSDAGRPRLGTLADRSVPTCSLDEHVPEVRDRLRGWELCVAVAESGAVLGVVPADSLRYGDTRRAAEVMQEGPVTFRPHLAPGDVLPHLRQGGPPSLLVTNLDGTLVGVVQVDEVRRAADAHAH